MSFSSDVKEELAGRVGKSRHCQLAELSAIIEFCGRVRMEADGNRLLHIQTENKTVAGKVAVLIEKAFDSRPETEFKQSVSNKDSGIYVVKIRSQEETIRILQAIKMLDGNGNITNNMVLVSQLLIQQHCCKRAFIRGVFLVSGSISDPEKFYHYELVCTTMKKAEQLRDILNEFDLDAKIVERKNHFVVYIKEGDRIVDVLNIMEAHVALMRLENVRIMKEMRNSINRQVNCETANINKTVSAAVKQVNDIEYIQSMAGLESLPDNLKEIAYIRLANKEASLKELGAMLEPPVGKSGVNHRLRKISIIAEEMREKRGGSHHD